MKNILYTVTKTLILDYVLNIFLNKVLCNFSKVSFIGNLDDPFNGKRYFESFIYQGNNGGILWIGHQVTIINFYVLPSITNAIVYRILLQYGNHEKTTTKSLKGEIIYIQEDIVFVEKYTA